MTEDPKCTSDLQKLVTPERLAELYREMEEDPWRQQVEALREKIEAGTATEGDRAEYNRLVPPLEENQTWLDKKPDFLD